MTNVYVLRELDRGADFILRSGSREDDEGRVMVDFGDLRESITEVENDLGYVAASLFACEELHNTGKINFNDESWIRFPVSSSIWNDREIKNLLGEILSYSTRCSIKPRFDARLEKIKAKPLGTSLKSVCLFSGGIDSLCGLLSLPKELKPTGGLFVSHAHMAGIVRRVSAGIAETRIYKVGTQHNLRDIQQLRGFLYICFGAILAKLSGAASIVISETGPTMYQPPYVPTDLVTVTTSPLIVELTKQFVEKVLEIKLNVYEPFEDLTKAEAMVECPNKGLLKLTNSCITSQFSQDRYPHCGHCLGCTVRRISAIVAGVEDSDYAYDVLMMDVGERIRARRAPQQSSVKLSQMNNLQLLMRFAQGMLSDTLPPYTLSVIEDYHKQEVFRRFALDIFAAVHEVSEGTRNRYIKKFYRESIRDSVVSKDQLEDRIAKVRAGDYKPNLSPLFQ